MMFPIKKVDIFPLSLFLRDSIVANESMFVSGIGSSLVLNEFSSHQMITLTVDNDLFQSRRRKPKWKPIHRQKCFCRLHKTMW